MIIIISFLSSLAILVMLVVLNVALFGVTWDITRPQPFYIGDNPFVIKFIFVGMSIAVIIADVAIVCAIVGW